MCGGGGGEDKGMVVCGAEGGRGMKGWGADGSMMDEG